MNRDILLKYFTVKSTIVFSVIVSCLNVAWELSFYGFKFDLIIYLRQFAATFVIAVVVFMCLYMVLALFTGNLNLRK